MKNALLLLSILLFAPPALSQPPVIEDLGDFRVDTDATYFIFGSRPRVAHDRSDGSFVIVWSSYIDLPGAFSTDVIARRYSAEGDPLSGEFLVNQQTDMVQQYVSLSPDPESGFMVVWQLLDPALITRLGVGARRLDSSGMPSGDDLIVDDIPSDHRLTSVSHAPDSSFMVVWEEGYSSDGSLNGINGRRYDASGEPIGDEFQVNAYTTNSQSRPRVSYGPDGTAIVVWHGATQGATSGIQARYFDPSGLPVGDEIQVSTSPDTTYRNPDISHRDDGSFVVVWDSFLEPPEDTGIMARMYDASGQPTGEPFRVDMSLDRPGGPKVSHGPAGSFVVVWSATNADDFTDSDVRARLYDASGEPIGEEFLVSGGGPERQGSPCLSFGPDGQLVVTWIDNLGPNDNAVFAKIYRVNLAPPEPVVEVPTLGTLGALLLVILLASTGIRRLR